MSDGWAEKEAAASISVAEDQDVRKNYFFLKFSQKIKFEKSHFLRK
jgi:hypothetical protein